jgi:hypothetical protein
MRRIGLKFKEVYIICEKIKLVSMAVRGFYYTTDKNKRNMSRKMESVFRNNNAIPCLV